MFLRGAHVLGLDTADINLAANAGLLEFGVNVRFRHPLVRSAVYRAAAAEDRRAAHAGISRSRDQGNRQGIRQVRSDAH